MSPEAHTLSIVNQDVTSVVGLSILMAEVQPCQFCFAS